MMRRLLPTCTALTLLFAPIAGHAQSAETRSPRVAAFFSLLLPGIGELYAGGPLSGRFFLFTEGSLWTGKAVFEHLETTRRENFRSHAAAHAGLNTDGKSDTFMEEVTAYESLSARNAHERFIRGDAADFIAETPENNWEWDTASSRSDFHVLRGKANSARQKGLLFVGGLLFNRFISAINAAHIARKIFPKPITFQILPGPDNGVQASLSASF